MTTTYTWDIFSTLDGYGSYDENGDWGGYWGKQGPELLAHRQELFATPQRMVFGATTFREQAAMVGPASEAADSVDGWIVRMRDMPATVVSRTLEGAHGWADVTVEAGDAVEVVGRLKEASDVPLRSHGSLALNRALLAAGLVDLVQVTLFPVVSGRTGTHPIFGGAPDLDLELVEHRTLDRDTQELTYRPTVHG
jgi:dihydrofolate reductase